jgi:hypothetical protein
MAPPQSYFDVSTPAFSLSLLNSPSYDNDSVDWHSDFHYHGRNVYAYLVSKYGVSNTNAGSSVTFDFVSIQFYESFSPADFALTQQMVPVTDYLGGVTQDITKGWYVDYSSVPELNYTSRNVSLSASQIVWGFSRGYGDGQAKSVYVPATDVGLAYQALPVSSRPRGFMFWNIEDEGVPANGTKVPCYFARSFNQILHTRPKMAS